MNLRADINWRAKDWLAFARNATQMLGNRYAEPAPLTPEERNRVLKLAVAYSLSNDTAALVDLRRKYDDKFKDTADASTFSAIASTITRDSGDPRQLAATIAQIGQYEAFMSHYRERVAKGGRSEEHTSELQSLMRISYAVFCLKKTTRNTQRRNTSKVDTCTHATNETHTRQIKHETKTQ